MVVEKRASYVFRGLKVKSDVLEWTFESAFCWLKLMKNLVLVNC